MRGGRPAPPGTSPAAPHWLGRRGGGGVASTAGCAGPACEISPAAAEQNIQFKLQDEAAIFFLDYEK